MPITVVSSVAPDPVDDNGSGRIVIASIENKVSRILRDMNVQHWQEAELLGWYNSAVKAIIALKPNAYVLNSALKLVKGTRQNLPAGSTMFISVRRNMGEDGLTPGRAPSFIDFDVMDRENPNWHVDQESAEIIHFAFDLKDPKHYYVWPPQPTEAAYAEIVRAAVPAEAISNLQTMALDDLYEGAIINFMLYRCYSKDAENLQNVAQAKAYLQEFAFLVTGKRQIEKEYNPALNHNGRKAAETP